MARILKYNDAKLKLISLIRELNLVVGDRLPSERELTERFGVSLVTLRRAVDDLVAAGNLERRHGVATIYTGNIDFKDSPALVGLVNVNDKNYPGGRSLAQFCVTLARYHAQVQLCFPGPEINGSLADDLMRCSSFLLTGFVNRAWTDFLALQNKPLLVVGHCESDIHASRIDCDWAAGMRLLAGKLAEMECKRPAVLLGDPRYTSNADWLRNLLCAELSHGGMMPDDALICSVPVTQRRHHLVEFLLRVRGTYDALVIETGNLPDYQMAVWLGELPPPGELPIVIVDEFFREPGDVPFPANLHFLFFEDDLLTAAAKILFEKSQSFFEHNQTHFTAPLWR